METTRFILFLSLALVSMMLWQAWEQDYGVRTAPQVTQQDAALAPADVPEQVAEDVPQFVQSEVAPSTAIESVESVDTSVSEKSRAIAVETDVFRLEIDSKGAGIRRAELLQYPVDLQQPDVPMVLMDSSHELFYIAQGGLLSAQAAPTHEQVFSTTRSSFSLKEGEDSLQVPFVWESPEGIKVTKLYEFTRGKYLVDVSYRIENNSGQIWKGRAYNQIKRSDPGRAGRMLIYTYTGAVISSPEDRYKKIDFDDMREQKLEQDITNGWVAMIQHYFVSALVPVDNTKPYRYYTMALSDQRFVVGAITPATSIADGESGKIKESVYLGPKKQKELAKIAEGLDLTVDFGVLWFIANPLFITLDWLHDRVGNWGWAILLVTLLLKLIFYPLSAAGYRSMANMRRVQPRIMSIRDRYKDDKARLNQAMMQIYKEEKINPLGGCFPILVQIPVFISLYWVLLESVELRQASFIFWWQDLSSPDPYYVLPIVMGITMYIQQKLNPAPMDPVQQKVLMVMPFAFTIFFAFFPSGLVLYWVANNVLSIAQQWMITRNLEQSSAAGQQKK